MSSRPGPGPGPSGRRGAAVLLLALLALLASSRAAAAYLPTAPGPYPFLAAAAGPFLYPPVPPPVLFRPPWGHGQEVRGSATFVSGWDHEAVGPHVMPALYASRYAASALPLPLAHQGHLSPRPHEPSLRLYGPRPRPAMIPTPYAKFSAHAASHVDKDGKDPFGLGSGSGLALHLPAIMHPHALALPQPGFYGGLTSHREEGVRHGNSLSLGYPDSKAAVGVGFYGKPSR